MRVLVVGSGGREHALAWKLSHEAEVLCTPGNPGIAEDVPVFDVPITDHDGLTGLAKSEAVDLVVIGPEDPLIEGLADVLRSAGLAVFGPGREGAKHEGSKAWSKQMMSKAGVPTADSETFTDYRTAIEFSRRRFDAGRQVVVKASGAAMGKGVVVCDSYAQAEETLDGYLNQDVLGEAGQTVVVEDRLLGREFSLFTMVSGPHFWSLPVAQDYKRVGESDQGPNTGGMGSYSPVEWLKPDLVREAESTIVAPMVAQMNKEGIDYRGLLFSGILVQDEKPYCLEFNVRFGDPETQSLMMRVKAGLAEALWAAANGQAIPPIEFLDGSAATVVAASKGYPGDYVKGETIKIATMPGGTKVFHAGTKIVDGHLATNGGRVLAVSAYGRDTTTARNLAYEGLAQVRFEGMQWRRDIAKFDA